MSEEKDVLPDDPAARRGSLEGWAEDQLRRHPPPEGWAALQERRMDSPRARMWASARKVRDWAHRIGYIRARWPRPLGTRPPIGLAVCAIFRDEARYLAEWVSFHRLQGVERFYLYDNRSTDDWRGELQPEIEAGIVDVLRWPFVPGQQSAYEDCLRRHRTDTRWIAFIDIDEFLFSPTGKTLPEILRSFDVHPGVTVNWRNYGTSGFKRPPEGLVTESYVWRGPDDMIGNRHVKSIVYPRRALGWVSAHYFRLQGNPVSEDRGPVSPLDAHAHGGREPTAELLRINHYYTRSEEEFRRKAASPEVNTGTINAARFARFSIPPDAVRDETVLQFGPQLREMLSSRAASAPPRPDQGREEGQKRESER